jgi:hypothetical protein
MLSLLAKLAKSGVAAGNAAYKYYTIINRLLEAPTTEATLRELEMVVQPMSEAERAGFTLALAGMVKLEKHPERLERQEAMLRTLPWGDAALRVSRAQVPAQPLKAAALVFQHAQAASVAAAPAPQRPQAGSVAAAAPAPQRSQAASATNGPAPQPFKADKLQKYTHRGYEITFADIRRPVIDIWEEGSFAVERMRRIDLAEHSTAQWITLHDWQNREVPVRAHRDGKEVWLMMV